MWMPVRFLPLRNFQVPLSSKGLSRLLRVPWTAKRSNPSILKEISPEYSLEGLMLKLELQYFGHLMRRTDSLEKTQILGKIEGRRRRDDRGWDGCMASPIQWTWIWVSSGNWWWTGKPGMLQSTGSQRVRHDWATELNWSNLETMRRHWRVLDWRLCWSDLYIKRWEEALEKDKTGGQTSSQEAVALISAGDDDILSEGGGSGGEEESTRETRDFPGSPVAKTVCSQCSGSLVKEVDPTCHN